jgi:hypothetical protein
MVLDVSNCAGGALQARDWMVEGGPSTALGKAEQRGSLLRQTVGNDAMLDRLGGFLDEKNIRVKICETVVKEKLQTGEVFMNV